MSTNVLIFPCESNSNELHDALSYCFNINVFGAASVARHGKYIYKNYDSTLPYVTDKSFLEKFNQYLDLHKIDIIVPQHDTIALFLAENKNKIHAKILQSDLRTNQICRSKILTHELFSDCDFIPIRFKNLEEAFFPAFIKPDIGEGGHGTFIANQKDNLLGVPFDKYLVTEFLPGKEYTVDCLTDKNGTLRYISPRTRDRIMAGISVAGHTESVSDEIKSIAEKINSRLSFEGLWYFQLRANSNGKLKLMEISVRCAGGMCLTRAKGINLPLLSIYIALGQEVSIFDNGQNVEMDRALISRYNIHINYEHVYIDFDDTITLRGDINPLAIFFLYQCKSKKKQVHLLTRHVDNIKESLKHFSISESLFKDIIHIQDGEPKSTYIKHANAIFIDNMFKERLEVKEKCNIPVFDADGFEFLLDWRI